LRDLDIGLGNTAIEWRFDTCPLKVDLRSFQLRLIDLDLLVLRCTLSRNQFECVLQVQNFRALRERIALFLVDCCLCDGPLFLEPQHARQFLLGDLE